MIKSIFVFLLLTFSTVACAEEYEIVHTKNFPYTGGAYTSGPDAVGGIAIYDGYFYAADHDPISGYGGLWRVDECGNNPGFTDIDSDRDGPIQNVYIGKKHIFTNGGGAYVYDKNGQKLVSKVFYEPYEIKNFVLDIDGSIYDISNVNNIIKINNRLKADMIPLVGIVDIQGNSLYADSSEGPGDLVYIHAANKIYLFSVDSNGLEYQDDIVANPYSIMFSDTEDNLYIYENKTIFHYKIENNSFILISKGSIPLTRNPKQFFITTIGGDKQAVFYDGIEVIWYDISDLTNIKFRTQFTLDAVKIAVKNNLIFRAHHSGIDIYLMKGKPLSQELYIQDNNNQWGKEKVTKTLQTINKEAEFFVKIDNKNEKLNKDHNKIISILKAPSSDDDFDIRYFVNKQDITSLITSNDGYKSDPITFNDSLNIKVIVKAKRSGVYKKEIEIESTVTPKSKCGIPIGSENKESVKAIVEKEQVYTFKAVKSNNCSRFDWGSKIESKIVNKDFNIQVLAKSDDSQEIAKDSLEINKVDLVDCTDEKKVLKELWKGSAKTKNGCVVINNLKYEKANKCANIKVYASDENNESKKSIKKYSLSDTFAIRPKGFFIEVVDSNSSKFKIGEEFKIKLHAYDQNNHDTPNYDISLDELNLKVEENKKNCKLGKIIIKSKNKNFHDGTLDLELVYDEIGEVKFYLEEKQGVEYAKIDQEDKDRFITPYRTPNSTKILPSAFKVDLNFIGKDDNNTVVYYAPKKEISEMGAEYSFDISVKNGKYTAENFTKGCYSEDLNITTNFTTVTSEESFMNLYVVDSFTDNVISNINKYKPQTDSSFVVKVAKERFTNGQGSTSKMALNFDRSPNNTLEPLDFIIKSAKIESENSKVSTIENNLNKTIRFYYLRLAAPLTQTTSEVDNTTEIFSEIFCSECDKNKFLNNYPAGNDIHWYRKNIENHDINKINPDITTTSNQIEEKELVPFNKIFIKPKQTPLTTKVYYTPSHDWLLYDKYDPNIIKYFYIVRFTSTGKWAGKGSLGSTVDTDDIPKIENQSIEW